MLMIVSTLFVVNTVNKNYLIAAGDPIPENNGMGLNYTYMWDITEKMSNIVHEYPEDTIPKGRAFGSLGCEQYAAQIIYKEMNDNLSINPKLEKLEPLGVPFDKRYYAQMMDVEGYRLTIEHPNYTTLPRNVPLTECFPIVAVWKDHLFGEFTHNYSMLESEDVRIISDSYFSEDWPFGGSLTGEYYNVPCYSPNDFASIIGNVTFIEDSTELPSDQTGYVFILDEKTGCENILNNISNITSVILLHSDNTKYNVSNVTKYAFPIERVNGSDENITDTIERLENGEIIFADNVCDTSQVTFTYDLASANWPPFNYTIIAQLDLDLPQERLLWMGQSYKIAEWLTKRSLALWGLNDLMDCFNVPFKCKGFIIYSDKNDDTHYMLLSSTAWSGILDPIAEFPGPYLPVFSINNTVGEFLAEQGPNSDNTISGYINQVYYEGTTSNNGIDAYDIVGHITIPKSPEDAIVVISNRHDSWFGECPLDSGAGAGIVLGIAKYFKEYDIIPKYNLTFLQDTGEELQFRGAQFYSDNHSDDNIIRFIGADQLGMEQQETYLNLFYKNDSTRKIVYAIANETQYDQRTKYNITHNPAEADDRPPREFGAKWGDGTDDHVWKRREIYDDSTPCDTIVVNKEGWTSHHQTGLNFREGDSLKNTNRSDLNITFELFWNITKYFCVNPDCEFDNVDITTYDSPNDGDTLPDTVRAEFSIDSILPSDRVMVNATLRDQNDNGAVVAWKVVNYTITTLSQSNPHNITITIPDEYAQGDYTLQLRLYNSTGRINITVDSDDDEPNEIRESDSFQLYHPFGNPTPGDLYSNTEDVIRGSYFTANEYGTARNITAYVHCGNVSGPPSIHSVCMIYRKSDNKLIGRTEDTNPVTGASPDWVVYNFTEPYPVLEEDTEYVLVCWSEAPCYLYYDHMVCMSRGRHNHTVYGSPPDPIVWDVPDNNNLYSIYCGYRNDTNPPWITNVTEDPHIVGFGGNVTITADVIDNESGVKNVTVIIGYPGGKSENQTMSLISNNTYQYVFDDSWLVGQYSYDIWAVDNYDNPVDENKSGHFHVSAEASISIATLQDSYSGNQYINITDPPNPLENYSLIDQGQTWNKYYNETTGQNILEVSAGPINYQEEIIWMTINNTLGQLAENHPAYVYGYRSGNNRGLYGAYFKSNAQSEWPVAFTYNKSDDPTIHAVRSKLVGVGYVDPQNNWAYQYLQNVQSSLGQLNGDSITYSGVFSGTDVTWSYGNTGLKEEITLSNTTKTVLQNHPPSQYGLNNASSYLVFITKLDYQNLNLYNSSGMLDGNFTVSDEGLDLKDVLGQFKCALPLGEAYELNNQSARQKLTYRIIHLNGSTYLLSGLKVSYLNAMTFPVVIDPTLSVNSHHNDGFISSSSTSYNTAWGATSGTIDSSSTYLTIGQKKAGFPISTYYINRGFVLFNTTALPSNAYLDSAILSLYKKDDYSTTDFAITIQNGQPTYPHNPLQTGDYDKGHYSGDGGSLNTAYFVNGRNNITVTELGWINETGWTKFCLRSNRDISGTTPTGNEYVNVYSTDAPLQSYVPKLIITYRNQSKIKNTGDTDIQGYLLIQVQFYNSTQGKWLVDNDTINETTARTVTSGNQLPLDIIFNGHVRASDLIHGTGTYRVYTAFRDPDGNILRTNDDTELVAWWQFSKT